MVQLAAPVVGHHDARHSSFQCPESIVSPNNAFDQYLRKGQNAKHVLVLGCPSAKGLDLKSRPLAFYPELYRKFRELDQPSKVFPV